MPSVGRISVRNVGAYLFVAIILFLAHSYLGTVFSAVFVAAVSLPVLSAVHLVASVSRLKLTQRFSNDHPVKGDELGYELQFSNEQSIASPAIRVDFHVPGAHHGMITDLPDHLDLILKANQSVRLHYVIRCRYRGVYTVGLRRLAVTDILGIITLSLPIYHRTFYVYPRIQFIDPERFLVDAAGRTAFAGGPGQSRDSVAFDGLRAYRPGDTATMIAWKKFAVCGFPVSKAFDRSSRPGITIYVDTRPASSGSGLDPLVVEDCSIEILVSVVQFFLKQGVPTYVRAQGRPDVVLQPSGREGFELFHRETIAWFFAAQIGPAARFEADKAVRAVPTDTVMVISHRPDPEIIDLAAARRDDGYAGIVILHVLDTATAARAGVRDRLETLRRDSAVYVVEHPENIGEDLHE